jgi:hypothetical protein
MPTCKPHTHPTCWRSGRCLIHKRFNVQVIRRFPSTVVIPTIILIALLAISVYGIVFVANSYAQSTRVRDSLVFRASLTTSSAPWLRRAESTMFTHR